MIYVLCINVNVPVKVYHLVLIFLNRDIPGSNIFNTLMCQKKLQIVKKQHRLEYKMVSIKEGENLLF